MRSVCPFPPKTNRFMRLVSSTMFLLSHFPRLLSLSLALHVDVLLFLALSVTEAQHKLCSRAFCSVINIKMRIYCFSGKFDMSFVLLKLRREQKGKKEREILNVRALKVTGHFLVLFDICLNKYNTYTLPPLGPMFMIYIFSVFAWP